MVMLQRIRSRIVFRTLSVVLGITLGIGLAASEMVGRFAWRIEAQRVRERVADLLAVVEPSASAACYVGDRGLAMESARGLLNSPTIAAVEIWGSGGLLAEARRPDHPAMGPVIVRKVPFPFAKDQTVGEVRVFPDANETGRSVARYVWALRGLVLVMAALVGTALAWAVMRTVVRPIKQISDRLNGLDASQDPRLAFPSGHEGDEIGRLVSNINEALDAEEQRRRLEQQVQQAQKISSLGSLAGGVAHDFNNMLAGIMAYSELLLAEEACPKRQKYLSAILSAASRSGELTRKLLAFGRRGKNRVEPVDVSMAVKECLVMVQPSLHPDLRVVSDLEDGLAIDGDPAQIQQVLVNLCINAVEAMPGEGRLTVSSREVHVDGRDRRVQRLPAGPYVELKVADTGPGIPPEILERIFEPFFTTKTREGESGTGLGLSTVYGIVEAHHGIIEVDSAPGKGSAFRVLLPKGRLMADETLILGVPSRGDGVVLVVEDEPLLRESARAALESLGYAVETAENGLTGVEAFRALHGRLQAVLLDLKMPLMGGREAFQRMRRIDPSVPVIICTGYGENEEVQSLISGGARGMLSKPYRILDLSEALRVWSGRRQAAGFPAEAG